MLRLIVALIAFIGTTLFMGLFALSYVSPITIEEFAREAIKTEVQRRVLGRIESASNSSLGEAAKKVLGENSAEIEMLREKLIPQVAGKVSEVAAKYLDRNCECRTKLADKTRSIVEEKIEGLNKINERLTALVESKYEEVTLGLWREFRIFTGANALAFLALFSLVFIKPKATLQLALPAGVLILSIVIVAYFYLFGQNWLHTLLFNEFVGFAYFAYLGVAVLAFIDIGFNRAVYTSAIFNSFAALLGTVLTAVPC